MLEVELGHFDPNPEFVMMTWNPPPLWVPVLLIAWIPIRVARSVWLLINVFVVLVSCLMLRFVYILKEGVRPLLSYHIIASVFPPALLAILAGQIAFLVLFGVAASVFLIKRERWFWAGAVLTLTSVKPHMVMLVGPYLVAYMATRRKWAGWLGLGVAGVGCLAILFILRPGWVADFSSLLDAPPIDWATPTVGGFLSLLGVGQWVRYAGIAFLLLIPVFLLREKPVSLDTAASVLILVTIPTTFFGWSYDQSLLLVPIAQIVGWLSGPASSVATRCTSGAAMVVAIAINLAQRVVQTSEVWFLWVPLAWGGIYGLAWWMVGRIRGIEALGSAATNVE